MITRSGKSIWPSTSPNYTGDVMTPEDIAVGLASQIRFGGQFARKYSVLVHTIVGSHIVDPDYRLHFALHDAPEAVVGDMVATWKPEEVEALESEILGDLSAEYGCVWTPEAWEAVKAADRACCAAEAHAIGYYEPERWWPREEFTAQAEKALVLTQTEIHLGRTLQLLLDEEAAISAYTMLLRSAGARLPEPVA